jgi:hypothetical protein
MRKDANMSMMTLEGPGSDHSGQASADGKPHRVTAPSQADPPAAEQGLLADLLRPPNDMRHGDQLYDRIRAKLFAEFPPTSYTIAEELNLLASLMVDLVSANKMIDHVNVPVLLRPEDQTFWQSDGPKRHNQALTERALAAFNEPTAPRLSDGEVKHFGGLIRHELTCPSRLLDGLAPLSEAEAAELTALPETEWPRGSGLRVLHRLLTTPRLDDILAGTVQPLKPEKVRIRRYLLKLLEHCKRSRRLGDLEVIEQRLRKAYDDVFSKLAHNPEQLIKLHEYRRKLSREFGYRLRKVRRLCRGSEGRKAS